MLSMFFRIVLNFVFRHPSFFLFTDNQADMSRRRPLHTCAASLFAVIDTACSKAQEFNGPLGKWAKRITKIMSLALPLMHVIQYQLLVLLSFTDDCILRCEKLVEIIFPPSTSLFDKIDKLVYDAEVMPGRFEEALNSFLEIMHRVPFLEWALIKAVWWIYGSHMEEKDIMIDMSSNNTTSNVTESADNANCPSQEAVSGLDSMENEVKTDNAKYHAVESSTINQSGDLISDPVKGADSAQEKKIKVDDEILEDDTSKNKTKSIGVKLKPEIVKVAEKGKLGKQTRAENSKEKLQSNSVIEEKVGRDEDIRGNYDPVLYLFESNWQL